MKETEDEVELDLGQVLDKQLAKFGLSMEDLPEEKQEELKSRVEKIGEGEDMRKSAMEQFRKSLG